MQAQEFYERVKTALESAPDERYTAFQALHQYIFADYTDALEELTESDYERESSDGRTIKQVVGHIGAWDRWTILCCGELIAGVHKPSMLRRNSVYIEDDGSEHTFESVDEFNAYQAEKQASQPYEDVRRLAFSTATALSALFGELRLLPPERLEATAPWRLKLPDGTQLETTAGWFLWYITLEHEGVEHAADLGID